MDPRPYHYEYRRPRFENRTYQSANLYESLYHRGQLNRYENMNNIGTFRPRNQFQRLVYEQSVGMKKAQNKLGRSSSFMEQGVKEREKREDTLVGSGNFTQRNHLPEIRSSSNRSNKSQTQPKIQQKPSILATYGKNTMLNQNYPQKTSIEAPPKLNQFSIYQKQQKPYNIICNEPQPNPGSLRKYPKLTLEFKLVENGKYLPS